MAASARRGREFRSKRCLENHQTDHVRRLAASQRQPVAVGCAAHAPIYSLGEEVGGGVGSCPKSKLCVCLSEEAALGDVHQYTRGATGRLGSAGEGQTKVSASFESDLLSCVQEPICMETN